MKTTVTKAQIIDFGVLTLRWYLAYYMADYGIGKITGGQFGVTNEEILNKPLKDVEKFYIAWHLFSLDKSFNIINGLMQIVGALLIVFNRTAIIGALFLLPVLFQIFLVDVAFTTEVFGSALPVRLAGMMLSAVLILFYYKQKIKDAFQILTSGVSTRFKYRWWVFLLLPLIGLLMDFVWGIVTLPLKLFIDILISL